MLVSSANGSRSSDQVVMSRPVQMYPLASRSSDEGSHWVLATAPIMMKSAFASRVQVNSGPTYAVHAVIVTYADPVSASGLVHICDAVIVPIVCGQVFAARRFRS
jgi:hypothetical protein